MEKTAMQKLAADLRTCVKTAQAATLLQRMGLQAMPQPTNLGRNMLMALLAASAGVGAYKYRDQLAQLFQNSFPTSTGVEQYGPRNSELSGKMPVGGFSAPEMTGTTLLTSEPFGWFQENIAYPAGAAFSRLGKGINNTLADASQGMGYFWENLTGAPTAELGSRAKEIMYPTAAESAQTSRYFGNPMIRPSEGRGLMPVGGFEASPGLLDTAYDKILTGLIGAQDSLRGTAAALRDKLEAEGRAISDRQKSRGVAF